MESRAKAEWVMHKEFITDGFGNSIEQYSGLFCSMCGRHSPEDSEGTSIETPFCPWCGAEMKGEE